MVMTDNNLCNSCTNIGCEFQSGIVRTKCAFYMPPHIEPDNCGNYAVMQPTIEAIQKADYENRLKADLEAILVELQLEIEEYKRDLLNKDIIKDHEDFDHNNLIEVISGNIQQKINSLKEV